MNMERENVFKVVMVGESGVGKTSIIQRYSSGVFRPNVMTIGAAYIKCTVNIEPEPVTLNVWDTAGQERFQSLIPLYTRSADCCIIVFDITSPNPVASLEKLYGHLTNDEGGEIYVVICGNKDDLAENGHEYEAAVEWARVHRLKFFKTSALSGEGIEELFTDVAVSLNGLAHAIVDDARLIMNRGETKPCC